MNAHMVIGNFFKRYGMALLTIVTVVCAAQSVQAGEWNCEETAAEKELLINVDDTGNVVDVTLADGSKITLPVGTPEVRIAELKKLLRSSSGDGNAFLHWELARQQQAFEQFADAENTFRELFDMSTISTVQRAEARAQLAELLAQHGKPRDIIALYERVDRPICGELDADAAYILSQAYMAVGNDVKAQQIFDRVQVAELTSSGNSPFLRKWKLLELRLDCVQKRWDQCAATFEALVRMSVREDSITGQLNTFTTRFRTMPQMSNVVERLQREGLITEQGIPSAEAGLVREQQQAQATLAGTSDDISCPDPVYPAEARKQGVDVKVTALLTFDERGKVSELKILEAQPDRFYIDGVITAARGCTVVPPVVLGMPASSSRIHRWNFTFTDSAAVK